MQEGIQFSGYFNGKSGIPPKTVALTLGISFACHAVLIGILFFLPGYSRPVVNPFPSAINVSLVSLPAGRPGPPAGSEAAIKSEAFEGKKAAKQTPVKAEKPKQILKPPVKAAKVPEKEILKPAVKTAKLPEKAQEKSLEKPTKAVSLNPKTLPKKKVETVEKKVETAELIKNAVKDMEKRVGESRPSSVSDAISRMKNQVESSDKSGNSKSAYQVKGFGLAGSGIKGAVPGVSGGSGSGNLPIGALDIYKTEIFHKIQQNWAYSEQIGGRGSNAMAVLVIKITHNGEISDIRFESKSQNRYLDESAYRAIQKSNPLPPLPKEYSPPYYEVGLRFEPSGLKQK